VQLILHESLVENGWYKTAVIHNTIVTNKRGSMIPNNLVRRITGVDAK